MLKVRDCGVVAGALPSVRLPAFSLTALVGDLPFTLAFAYAGHSVQSYDASEQSPESFWIFRGVSKFDCQGCFREIACGCLLITLATPARA